MTDDLDVRIADALFDAASSTTVSDDAFDAIIRRAERAPRGVPRRRAVVVGGCVAAAAAGVAGFAATRGPGGPPAPAVEVVATPEAPEPTLPTAGLVDGPLVYDDATLLSILYVNFGVGTVQDESRMRDDPRSGPHDAAMRECMVGRGFPHPARGNGYVDSLVIDPRWTLSPADFAARYGFGVAAEHLGLIGSGSGDGDPYVEYLESLAPGEREAFDAAEQECYRATAELSPAAPQSWISAHDYAHAQFAPLVEDDARIVAARDAWSECMAAAGFEYDDPSTIVSSLGTQLFNAGLVTFGTPPEPGTQVHDDLEAFMADEVVVATANVGCIAPYDEAVRAVVGELYPQYKEIFQAALAAGVESDAQGFR